MKQLAQLDVCLQGIIAHPKTLMWEVTCFSAELPHARDTYYDVFRVGKASKLNSKQTQVKSEKSVWLKSLKI